MNVIIIRLIINFILRCLRWIFNKAEDSFKTFFLGYCIAVNYNFFHEKRKLVPFWALLLPLAKKLRKPNKFRCQRQMENVPNLLWEQLHIHELLLSIIYVQIDLLLGVLNTLYPHPWCQGTWNKITEAKSSWRPAHHWFPTARITLCRIKVREMPLGQFLYVSNTLTMREIEPTQAVMSWQIRTKIKTAHLLGSLTVSTYKKADQFLKTSKISCSPI